MSSGNPFSVSGALNPQSSPKSDAHYEELSQEEATNRAIEDAERAINRLKLARGKVEQARLRAEVKSYVETAERIKNSNHWPPNLPPDALKDVAVSTASKPSAKLAMHVSRRDIGTSEEIILLKGCKVNGMKFLVWEKEPSMEEFVLGNDNKYFEDDTLFSMSEEQEAIFDSWQRPVNALPPLAWRHLESTRGAAPTMQSDLSSNMSIDLVQDAATDCSVVASLCAGIARAASGHFKILSSIFYPYDDLADCPRLSANGKYIVKLNFNGTSRKVVVDDRLPVSKSERALHVVDRNNPCLLWPALLEKAYLKVRGGYDFPGSNSGTDLWMLTGWIPEQVFLREAELDRDSLWLRVMTNFQGGNVLVTLGTGSISDDLHTHLGLVGQHDYAILDIQETLGRRQLLIKNPWSKGGCRQAPELDEQSGPLEEAPQSASPGTFWMTFEDVMQYFENLYLNWNPALFTHREDVHYSWDLSYDASDTSRATAYGRSPPGSFATNPQHTVTPEKDGMLWILLSRHFSDNAPPLEEVPRYISLYAFDSDGKRVHVSKCALEQGPYVDSPQTLLRLDHAKARNTYTIVTSEEDFPAGLHNFTLSAFATCDLIVDSAVGRFKQKNRIGGSWTKDTAGGNASSSNYQRNPQFSLTLSLASQISVLIQTLQDDLRIHVKVLHSNGDRVFEIKRRDIVIDSKEYRKGWALAEMERPVDAGSYTLICSTFDEGQIGHFDLTIETNCMATIKPIPREGAGRRSTLLAVASFGAGVQRLGAPLRPARFTTMKFIAAYVGKDAYNAVAVCTVLSVRATAPSPLRMSVEVGRGPDRIFLMTSGDGSFSTNTASIRTNDFVLDPSVMQREDIWLVLERLGGGYSAVDKNEERIQVEMQWDAMEPVGVGVWREI